MSVSDPLIKDIKGRTLALYNESCGGKIQDSDRSLVDFCRTLEKIFYQGLTENRGVFYGNKKNEPFDWMASVVTKCDDNFTNFNYENSLAEVKDCKNTRTFLGKFRLLMRANKTQLFYEKHSIIGDEILSSILISVLVQCNKINFDLYLINSSFLDSTWLIPDLVELELVPCKNLGISISFSENKAVIVHIRANSVASECDEISIGDIIVNLNGVEINTSCRGRLNTILRTNKGRPIVLFIIKALRKESRDVFPPIRHILRNLQIDLVKITEEKKSNLQGNSNLNASSGYRATYLGCIDVGNKGNVKQIEKATKKLLLTRNVKDEKTVIFEVGEVALRVLDLDTSEIIFKHSYMQISSCGLSDTASNYVAYIAGNENCDVASKFICYVFHLESREDVRTILQSIGQGFQRTHFAV